MPNPYLQTELQTASPEVLIGRLLDRAVSKVRSAEELLESEPVASTAAVRRAVDIVSELREALDFEVGGEIATNLDALYEFVNRRLVVGCTGSDTRALDDGRRVLETLAETWSELLEQLAASDE